MNTITLTDAAAAKVASLISAEDVADLALRIAVRPGGYSGFSYEMYFDSERASDDEVQCVRVDDADFDVVVDPASRPLLAGAVLDYSDGLNQTGFKITNEANKRQCGCGQSFSG
jgi:iron-sulfur cluster assembly accessory protein